MRPARAEAAGCPREPKGAFPSGLRSEELATSDEGRRELGAPGGEQGEQSENVVWRGYSSILSSIGIDLEVAYAFGPAQRPASQRPARPGTQAAGEGRGRGGDSAGGRGAHRQGSGTDGTV